MDGKFINSRNNATPKLFTKEYAKIGQRLYDIYGNEYVIVVCGSDYVRMYRTKAISGRSCGLCNTCYNKDSRFADVCIDNLRILED